MRLGLAYVCMDQSYCRDELKYIISIKWQLRGRWEAGKTRGLLLQRITCTCFTTTNSANRRSKWVQGKTILPLYRFSPLRESSQEWTLLNPDGPPPPLKKKHVPSVQHPPPLSTSIQNPPRRDERLRGPESPQGYSPGSYRFPAQLSHQTLSVKVPPEVRREILYSTQLPY
ncbi:hypothetical protein K493DRAFT_47454 [Basidiobolus meristosporus CBS 931.73]|uniref:Uncharacterized protein n=1 Tax=Basidiobolus meristosporus CBS 931.73 TaxID=1314790 RepID=A0A1Y1Y1P1_9FUNG|nr:hypothetical protein K493DRAFT_47454 [Basidiobolus meristosporus CBS 931.73]|eukprot:ORX91932.1 hypothetical protein K493DRAFT_47454 [Basidiobolus meristosporus CBS 931.73]